MTADTEAAAEVAVLALYLPQFHPIPENDEFWGTGFTEWNSVVAAKQRYSDHRQPRLPGELGTYDLRQPGVVAAQERLACTHGVTAFAYYHYWFEGHRVMGGPFDAKLADRSLAMPFLVCWANHDWNRSQNGRPDEVLIAQTYSEQDDIEHSAFLAQAMEDPRWFRVDGRPVFIMYRTHDHPAPQRFAQCLRAACASRGVADPYLIRCETNGTDQLDPAEHGFDAGTDLHPHWLWHTLGDRRPRNLPMGLPDDFWMDYDAVAAASSARSRPAWTRFPCVVPDWDCTARRPTGGSNSLRRATAIGYETWLAREFGAQRARDSGPRLVLINAWNEWSECGYLEPDGETGRAWLDSTARAVGVAPPLTFVTDIIEEDLKMYDLVIDPEAEETAYRSVLELSPRDARVLEVGCGAGHLTEHLQRRGNAVTAVDINPTAAARAARFAVEAFAIDLDREVLAERLRGAQFDCVVLADVLEHVRSPQRVLTDVLGLLAPNGTVVISVPNISHIDTRLMLMQGRWDYQPTGLLDDTHLRFFTRSALESMLRDAGLHAVEWRRTERQPFTTNLGVAADQVAPSVVAQLLTDPDATTYQFIVQCARSAEPETVTHPPTRVTPLTSIEDGDVYAQLAVARAELDAYRNLKVLRVVRIPRAAWARIRRLLGRG